MTHIETPDTSPRWFALLPLTAILLGAVVAWRSGVPVTAFAVNALAAALGVGIAALVGRLSNASLLRAAVPTAFIAVLLTASTLLFPGLDGIHRWWVLGPVRLHASALAVPCVLMGMSVALRERFAVSAVLAMGLSAVHAAQPDAGQGTAFALAASTLLSCARSTPWLLRAFSCAGTLVIGFAAWLRPDPLAAVPHVERIVHLAMSMGPAFGVAAVLALALLLVPAALGIARARASEGHGMALSASLVVYIAATLGVTALGNFPVPVMGAGAGPVLGWYVATGVLTAGRRARPGPRGSSTR